MATVFANGRSIVHKGDGGVEISGAPDVCKTPTPGGPVPIPYVNIAKTSDLSDGSKKTKIEGNPIALKSSKLSTSSGDEPGTAGGGIISSKTKGTLKWVSSSFDVQIEGKGVIRFMDATLHNGNMGNTVTPIQGGSVGVAIASTHEIRCPMPGCENPNDFPHPIPEAPKKNQKGHNTRLMSNVFVKQLQKMYEKQLPVINEHIGLNKEIKKNEIEKAKLYKEKRQLTGTRQSTKYIENKILVNINKKTELKMRRKILNDILVIECIVREVVINDLKIKAFVGGYMIAMVICKCKSAKAIACSGETPNAFKEKAKGWAGYELAEIATMSNHQKKVFKDKMTKVPDAWTCAEPKIFQKIGSSGHKAKEFTARYFSPDYRHKSDNYSNNQVCPPCKNCQLLLPYMLCKKVDQKC